MARLQYQPATRARGFQPIQLSRAGIARMEEEGNRVIRNLEQQRDAENSQRRDNLQAMQANSVYEQQEQEKNRRILETNRKVEEISNANKAKSIESTFGTLVDFSQTLGKQAAARTKQMIEDQTAEGAEFRRQEYLNSPELQNKYKTVESQVDVETEILDQNTIRDGALGFDSPLQTAKNLASNPGRGYYWKKGYYNELIIEQTPMLVNRALQGTEAIFTDTKGNKFSGIEAVDNAEYKRIVLGQIQNSLRGSTGLNIDSLEPGFLEKSNKFVAEFNSTSIRQAADAETRDVYNNLTQQGVDLMDQGRVPDAYRLFLKIPSIGNTGALDKVFAYGSAIDPRTGDFLISIDDFNNLRLTGDKTILEERGNSRRYLKLIAARRKALSDYRRDDAAFTRQEAKDFANKALPQMIEYFENADAQGDLTGAATFEKEFYAKFPNESLPSGYVRAKKAALKENYDAEVATIQARARTQTLDKEFVDAIESPKLQLAAIKALKEQESAKYGPKYDAMKKSLVSEAKTLTKFDPTVEGPGSGTTIMVTNALKNEYKYFFKTLVDKGVPVDAAADQAYVQLTEYVAKAQTDKTNKFFRDTAVLNKPSFPNIQGATQALSASSQEQRNELNKLILKHKADVGSVFSIPNAILSETQIETTINSYYANNGTFRVPLAVQYAAPLAGKTFINGINEAIQASNEKHGKNRRLLTPSPVEEAIFDQVPSVQKLFTDYEKMSTTRLSRGTAHITGTAGPRRAKPLNTYAPQVSSITYDTGQPGIDVFFEDHNFPAVLPGMVKDIGYQVNANGSGYGHYLVLESIDPATGEPVDVLYGHLPTAPTQSRGQSIGLGEIIGQQGGTGSVQSYDGTIASIDFLAPAPPGSGSMTPYRNYDSLRKTIASQLK